MKVLFTEDDALTREQFLRVLSGHFPDAVWQEVERKTFRRRFLVQLGGTVIPVRTADVAYFFAEQKNNYLVTREGAAYIVDASLDRLAEQLDPLAFFRASRSLIVHKERIRSLVKLPGGRFQIRLDHSLEKPGAFTPDLTVSRSRADDFLLWLEQ